MNHMKHMKMGEEKGREGSRKEVPDVRRKAGRSERSGRKEREERLGWTGGGRMGKMKGKLMDGRRGCGVSGHHPKRNRRKPTDDSSI